MSKVKATPAKTAATARSTRPPVPEKKAAQGKPSIPAKPARSRAAPPAAAKSSQASGATKAARAGKPRQKPVRDSFTMPAADFALIAALKARLLAAKRVAKKSELLRAGLHALTALGTPALIAALGKLDQVKVGRPRKGH
jgi:hypothetical protein